MRKSGFTLGRASAGVLAAGMLTAAALVIPAVAHAGSTSSTCPSSAGKCFGVTVTPLGTAAGTSQSFTFTLTNEAPTQQLGSVSITAPSGFVITKAPGATTVTSGSARFLNLAVAPGSNASLSVTASAPCGGGAYSWGLEVKQSNDFSGPPGNDFQMDSRSGAYVNGTVTGACSLAFSGEPNSTETGHVIKTGPNSSGGYVQVEVLDGNGQLATSFAGPIAMALSANPGSGSLSGTTTVNASAGVAPFTDLSISAAGSGYILQAASSQGISPVNSTPFSIYDTMGGCSGSCSGSSSDKSTYGSVTTSSGTAGDLLGVGLGGVSYTCNGGYQPVSDPVNVDLLSASGTALFGVFTATLEISKNAVQASGHTGASTWQVCYADTSYFTPRPGTQGTATIAGAKYYTGLLPDCSSTQGAPCVKARNKDNAGDVVITLLASGDLVFRG